MNTIRDIYRVVRTILFSAVILVAVAYLVVYILLSIPSVQNKIRDVACRELSAFMGGNIKIDRLDIRPFNEVVIDGVEAYTPTGARCVRIDRVGAGVNIWRLLAERKIEITYGEIIGLDAAIVQQSKGGPLNIQYIIDAFAPKDKNKPPSRFDLKLRNVVLRRCRATFDRDWQPRQKDERKTDFNHLSLTELKADIMFPSLSNNDIKIDLRRMAFNISGGLCLEKLAFRAHLTPTSLSVEDLVVKLPGTELRPSDQILNFKSLKEIKDAVREGEHHLVMVDNPVSLPDFKWLLPELENLNFPLTLSLDASGGVERVNVVGMSIDSGDNLNFSIAGSVAHLDDMQSLSFTLGDLTLSASQKIVGRILETLGQPSNNKAMEVIRNCGDISLSGLGSGTLDGDKYNAECELVTSCGSVSVYADARKSGTRVWNVEGGVSTDNVDVSRLLGGGKIGAVQGDAAVSLSVAGKNIDGSAEVYLSGLEFNGRETGGIAVEALKSGDTVSADVTVDNDMANATLTASGERTDGVYHLSAVCDVRHFEPSELGMMGKYAGYALAGTVTADLSGHGIDDASGEIDLSNVRFGGDDKLLTLDNLRVTSSSTESGHTIEIDSDWMDGEITGNFRIGELPHVMSGVLAGAFPSLFVPTEKETPSDSDIEVSLLVKPDNDAMEFFNLPFRLLVPVPVAASMRGADNSATLSVDVPYIQQGKNKLVRDSRLNLDVRGKDGIIGLELASTFPAKKGDLSLDVRVWGEHENLYADIGWRNPVNERFKGLLSLGAVISKDEMSPTPNIHVDISPSIFDIGPARWNIDRGAVSYEDKVLKVENFKIWHDDQFVSIDGTASQSPSDSISVRLADIDLDYIFDLLKINYVTFGGEATGELIGKSVFSSHPEGGTDNLMVRNLSYNGAVLGDALISSHWENEEKEVTIRADISHDGKRRGLLDGGIWVTRDSLSFEVDADKIPIDFLKPFMSAFTSDVKGYASGNAKLFGTFSDIDLTGRLFADTIAMKLDFTNTWYHGSDSVYLDPGHIKIPSFRLYDRNGNSATLTGDLTHRYFHEPRFTFKVTDARGLLCYDTNAKMNPNWYGTLYGNGNAVVRGWPGTVNISVDMDIVRNSAFTFVLNDTQAAEDYHFLTFTDRRKEEAERQRRDTVADVLSAFRKKIEAGNSTPSKFSIDIRATVNPSSLMTLVMDPVAGDKITARGNGAMQMEYDSDSEELLMFGKYTLDEGSYNFSLQDLILRDFTIRPGSTISFNGDPMNADLDITASYRVNTNLSDLDKSFSTDKDLARTNVPVDAMLMVDGEMQHPGITFDIELPTLTQDVERKVKSIVSTDDMMSRQIIYLLALNRFYTPEYMGSSSNGGELAAVASTTLSSQLSNIIGQLTDKFTLSPTFRSDKGDFSDIEVDVALSSRLLDNRLLVNGNFGYRDRNTSSTTFVGDFDIEYLLNRRGNLRLKAYNHFNDQNYYLREALTTQGIGIIFRRDFDDLFPFLRRKRKKNAENKTIHNSDDSGKGAATSDNRNGSPDKKSESSE